MYAHHFAKKTTQHQGGCSCVLACLHVPPPTAPHVFHLRFPASFSSSSVSCSVSGMNISLSSSSVGKGSSMWRMKLCLSLDSMDSKPEGRERGRAKLGQASKRAVKISPVYRPSPSDVRVAAAVVRYHPSHAILSVQGHWKSLKSGCALY